MRLHTCVLVYFYQCRAEKGKGGASLFSPVSIMDALRTAIPNFLLSSSSASHFASLPPADFICRHFPIYDFPFAFCRSVAMLSFSYIMPPILVSAPEPLSASSPLQLPSPPPLIVTALRLQLASFSISASAGFPLI